MSNFGVPHWSIESAGNTTTTPLGISATFTGSAEQNDYPTIGLDWRTDAPGTLFTDFSVDGTNWTTFPVSGYSLNALNNYTIVDTATKFSRHVRIRFINSTTSQTFLRGYTYYGVFDQLNSPLNQSYNLNSGSRLVRSSWTWLDVSRGLAKGLTTVEKFGRAIVGTTFTPICLGGVYQTPQSGGGTTLRIAAGNPNDSAAGSGARSAVVQGIEDGTWLDVEETLVSNGAAAGPSGSISFVRVYRTSVGGSGTYATASAQSHAGDIVIENSAGGTTFCTIGATGIAKGQSEIGAYTCAKGRTAFVKLRHVTVDTGKKIDLIFFSRLNADQTAPPYSAMRAQSVLTGVTGGEIQAFGESSVPLGPMVGPCDFGFMGRVDVGTATIAVEFEIFLVDE